MSARQFSTAATADGLDTLAEKPIDPDPDEGITTDELMGASGMNPEEDRWALHDLERLGIAGNDTAATAFVHRGVPRASTSRLAEPNRARVCAHRPVCRRPPPTWSRTTRRRFHRRVGTQRVKDAGHTSAVPEQTWRVLQGTGQGRTRRTGRPGRPPESAQARPRRGAARLLSGFRCVHVDDYLDVGPEQFALIVAIADRTLEDGDEKIALLAVGDDQSVYAFRAPRSSSASASSATTAPGSLSSPTTTGPSLHIVAVANSVIERTAGWMKAGHSIYIKGARRDDPPGADRRFLTTVQTHADHRRQRTRFHSFRSRSASALAAANARFASQRRKPAGFCVAGQQ